MKLRLLGVFHILSILSLLLAGLVGAMTMSLLGDPLAQGAAIYLGATAPEPPGLAYPWWPTIMTGGGSLVLLVLQKKLSYRWTGVGSLMLALVFVLLPWVQFFRMAAAALASGMGEPGF